MLMTVIALSHSYMVKHTISCSFLDFGDMPFDTVDVSSSVLQSFDEQ